jgi:hypothetical protein
MKKMTLFFAKVHRQPWGRGEMGEGEGRGAYVYVCMNERERGRQHVR